MNQPQALYRILDAATNRACEGLRTVEEYSRMVLEDAALTAQLKTLRHELSQALRQIPAAHFLNARDTEHDIGTTISAENETLRSSMEEVVAAAWSRVQQSLRTLEEYGKVVSGDLGGVIESLRYRTYTLQQQTFATNYRRQFIEQARLYVLVDCQLPLEQWTKRLEVIVAAGVDVVQLRDKQCDDLELFRRAELAVQICQRDPSRRCRLIVNDRADIAAAVDADGVHVGQEELPVAAVRRVLGPGKLVGVSTHDLAQVRQALADGADYIGCGPTFPSQTKTFVRFAGLEFLREVVSQQIPIPAFAIGGIQLENVEHVIASGFNRIAVSGAVWSQADPAKATVVLQQRLSGIV